MFKIILTAIFVAVNVFAQALPSVKQIKKDFDAGEGDKYMYESLPLINENKLIEDGILVSLASLKSSKTKDDIAKAIGNNTLHTALACPSVGINFTTSIYKYDLDAGVVYCAVAKKGNVYEPFGLFQVYFSGLKEYFTKDVDTAKTALKSNIESSSKYFEELLNEKDEIRKSIASYTGNQYLNIPDLFLAAILADTDIIDMQATANSGKLQLNNGYNADILSNTGSVSNADYISTRANTIGTAYSRLSDLNMTYLALLVVFFGVWGVGGTLLRPLMDRAESQQNQDKKLPYFGGIILGMIAFFPLSASSPEVPGLETQDQYSVYHTRFQDFERSGYYLFMNWASDTAKVLVDVELDNIIVRSGLVSEEAMVSLASSLAVEEKKENFGNSFINSCNSVYNEQQLAYLSPTPNRNFIPSERYLHASSIMNGSGPTYYNPVSNSGYVQAYATGIEKTGEYYPPMMISSCGRAEDVVIKSKKNIESYTAALAPLKAQENPALMRKKIDTIKQLIKFQYELHRNWGPLSILGLPVTVMQTEDRGIYMEDPQSEAVLNKLKNESSGDDSILHSFLSTIPYLFLPGVGTVFQVSNEAIGDVLGAVGASVGTGATPGLGTVIGGLLGKVAGKVIGTPASLYLAYKVASQLLLIAPVIAIIIIGVLRFVIIMVKIFAFHFISLFMMPIMFAKENWRALSAFAMKIFATMAELPVFVLSIWLAMMANNLIKAFGQPLSKELIIGMLNSSSIANSSAYSQTIYNSLGASWDGFWAKVKIYMYDGLMEMMIAVFSIVIIYKIITTIHTTLFEVFEIKTSGAIDNAVGSIKSDGQQWGAKV
jgi:hypothetical protein